MGDQGHEGTARHAEAENCHPVKLRTATITSSTNTLRQRLTRSGNVWATSNFRRESAYIVLTSRDQASYQKDSGALEKVLKTLVYVEPKSEVASGQEFAHRYRQLQDKHAEAQIEPLLTEWREKAPDDPDAWITSANYYFNQRQMNIEMKEPRPGDITMTDTRTGKVGTISFEEDKRVCSERSSFCRKRRRNFPITSISGAGSPSFTRRVRRFR